MIPLDKAKEIAKRFLEIIKPKMVRFQTVGSLSRSHNNVKDIDFVIQPISIDDFLVFMKENFQDIKSISNRQISLTFETVDIDIWLATKENFSSMALHYELGKKIIRYKTVAKNIGMKLTRDGLYNTDGKLITSNGKMIIKIIDTKIPNDVYKSSSIKKYRDAGEFPRVTKNYLRFRQTDPKKYKKYKMKKTDYGYKVIGIMKNGTEEIQSIIVNYNNIENNIMNKIIETVNKSKKKKSDIGIGWWGYHINPSNNNIGDNSKDYSDSNDVGQGDMSISPSGE